MAAYSYLAYGLSIRSELYLPELGAGDADSPAHVTIRFGAVPEMDMSQHPWGYRALEDGVVLSAPSVATFWVRGDEIILAPVAGVAPEVLRLFLLSRPLAMLLQLRGLFVLHGSSISLEGKAVIFVGTKRAGKSTTAGAFHRRGAVVLSDDISAVDVTTDPPNISAGWQRIKLWPDALAALGHGPSTSELLRTGIDKRAQFVPRALPGAAIDVTRIYLLCPAEQLEIEALAAADRCMALVRHAYASPHWVGNEREVELFGPASHLAATVSIQRLHIPREISQLDDLVDKVLGDLA